MARATWVFGVVLVVLGAVYFLLTGSFHPTALIPAAFGFALFACGVLADTAGTGRRMLWMHIAVSVGPMGFLFPGDSRWDGAGAQCVPDNGAADRGAGEIVMAVIWAGFTALCVRSFVVARVGRTA